MCPGGVPRLGHVLPLLPMCSPKTWVWFRHARLLALRRVSSFSGLSVTPHTGPHGCVWRGGVWLSPLALRIFWGSPCVALIPRAPLPLSGGLLLFTLPARCAARRVRPPFGPLAWRPSPARPLKVLVQAPLRGAGALSTPGASPLRSSRRGRAAAARVGTLCASADRWGLLVDAPPGPRLSAPASPSCSASPHGRLRRGLGGPVLFSVVPPSGALSLSALAPYPGFPPPPVRW